MSTIKQIKWIFVYALKHFGRFSFFFPIKLIGKSVKEENIYETAKLAKCFSSCSKTTFFKVCKSSLNWHPSFLPFPCNQSRKLKMNISWNYFLRASPELSYSFNLKTISKKHFHFMWNFLCGKFTMTQIYFLTLIKSLTDIPCTHHITKVHWLLRENVYFSRKTKTNVDFIEQQITRQFWSTWCVKENEILNCMGNWLR